MKGEKSANHFWSVFKFIFNFELGWRTTNEFCLFFPNINYDKILK